MTEPTNIFWPGSRKWAPVNYAKSGLESNVRPCGFSGAGGGVIAPHQLRRRRFRLYFPVGCNISWLKEKVVVLAALLNAGFPNPFVLHTNIYVFRSASHLAVHIIQKRLDLKAHPEPNG